MWLQEVIPIISAEVLEIHTSDVGNIFLIVCQVFLPVVCHLLPLN